MSKEWRDPEAFLDACKEYFLQCEDSSDELCIECQKKMRAGKVPTHAGLALHLGLTRMADLDKYRSMPGYEAFWNAMGWVDLKFEDYLADSWLKGKANGGGAQAYMRNRNTLGWKDGGGKEDAGKVPNVIGDGNTINVLVVNTQEELQKLNDARENRARIEPK